MQFSQLFLDIRAHFEGLKFKAYQDSAGIWTIGIGTTIYPDGSKVKQGDVCTVEQAYAYAQAASDKVQIVLNHTLPEGLNNAQFDALGDLVYNIGEGQWRTSTIHRIVQDPANLDYDKIDAAFMMWDKAHVDGKLQEVDGLKRRRKCESFLFKNGYNHPTFFQDN